MFQGKAFNTCVVCLSGEVGSAILICVQNQCDLSGMVQLPPRCFGVEVGRGRDGGVNPVQQIGPSSVGLRQHNE